MSWMSDGQFHAASAVSAALQRLNDPDTLRLLDAVPSEAWGCGEGLLDDVDIIRVALRNNIPDVAAGLLELERYAQDKADPWSLQEHCEELTKLWDDRPSLVVLKSDNYKVEFKGDRVTVRAVAPLPEPEPDTLLPITFASLAAAHPHLSAPVIDGLLRQGETMNVIAASKMGKSWMVYDLALSIATGGLWLDYFQCTAGRVLIIDNELHPQTLANRIPKVAEARQIAAGWESRLDVLPLRGVGLTLDALATVIQKIEAGHYAVIVLDAWYRFIPSGHHENDNADIMSLYNMLDKYAASTGAAMIAIHHQSKGAQGDKAVTDVGAGAGAQSRAADTHLILRQHEEDGCIVLDAAVRSFPPVEPLGLRWDFPVWQPAYNLDTDAIQGRRPRNEVQRDEKDRTAIQTILGALADGPMSVRDVRRVLGGAGQQRAERLLDRLENDGAVKWELVRINGGTGKVYSLTDPGLEPGLEPGTVV